MNKPYCIVILGLVLSLLSGAAHATDVDDDLIYAKTLNEIVALETHEHPEQPFVIWDRAISAEVFSSERVPRQAPVFQFTQYIKGVTPGLELILIYSNLKSLDSSGTVRDDKLKPFPVTDWKPQFGGFLASSKLQDLERSMSRSPPYQAPIVIGFSRVGYLKEHHQWHALVYVENGLLVPNGPYGGRGFFYVKQGDDWKLEGRALLFDGDTHPFWRW